MVYVAQLVVYQTYPHVDNAQDQRCTRQNKGGRNSQCWQVACKPLLLLEVNVLSIICLTATPVQHAQLCLQA
jgi:hypothetical protein